LASEPRIGVVTVSFNSGRLLHAFLGSVFGQTLSDFRLYVIDNASKDDSVAIVKESHDERVKLIENAVNLGVAEGNNQGIRAALADGCKTVLFLNNDTEFPNDLFAQLYSALEENNCDMATGKVLYFEPSNLIWCAGGWFDPGRFYGAFHYGMGEKDTGQYDEPRRITYAPTCCLLVSQSVFQRIGMMDSKYFVYSDDVDFLYRCLRRDISLWYIPKAMLFHKVSSLTGGDESDFAIRFMTRNRMYFIRKHLSAWQSLIWGAHFLACTAPKLVLFGHDSISRWRLRCASLFEGLRMAHD
jgi:GT2 family glycosyltransferase